MKKINLLLGLSTSAVAGTVVVAPSVIATTAGTNSDVSISQSNLDENVKISKVANGDYYVPKIATDVKITNDNAVEKLAELGITLTLEKNDDFSIDSYSISKGNSNESVKVTISITSKSKILKTTEILVSGFKIKEAKDLTQTQVDDLVKINLEASSNFKTQINNTNNQVDSNNEAIEKLKEIGISLTLEKTPEGFKEFKIKSYSITLKNNTSVNVTISGTSGTTQLTTSPVTVSGFVANNMTQIQASDYAKISTSAIGKNSKTPNTATNVAITNANAVAELAKLGINLSLGTTPTALNPFIIKSYSISKVNDTSVSVTITGTSGTTNLTTNAVTVSGFNLTDMTQIQVDAYAKISASAIDDIKTPESATNVGITNTNAVTELEKLGISLTLGTTPVGFSDFVIKSYSIKAVDATSISITISGTSGTVKISTTSVIVSGFTLVNMTQTQIDAYAKISTSAIANFKTPAATTNVAITNANATTELAALGINLTLGKTTPAGVRDFIIESYTIKAVDATSISITISGEAKLATTEIIVSGFTANNMNQSQVNEFVKISPIARAGAKTPKIATNVAITNANAINELAKLGITLTLGDTPVGYNDFVIESYSITLENNTSVKVTISGTSGAAKITTTATVVYGFAVNNMSQSQVNEFVKLSPIARDNSNTPKIATNVPITNANAITELAKLGINLTLGTTPVGFSDFVIESYSITLENNTSVKVTISGTSGTSKITTKEVIVSGFETNIMSQDQVDAYVQISKTAKYERAIPNDVSNAHITNANAVNELAKLGIDLALGTTPIGFSDFVIESYSITGNQDASVNVTITGTSGLKEFTTTATVVSNFPSSFNFNNIQYEFLNNKEIIIKSSTLNEVKNLKIGSELKINTNTYKIVKIAADAFKDKKITGSLTISNTITSIGDRAFKGNQFSGVLNIPDSVTSIGSEVFTGNKFNPNEGSIYNGFIYVKETFKNEINETNFTGIKIIGYYTINTGINNLVMPNKISNLFVTSIGDYAFNNNNFVGNLKIPNTITSIGNYAFSNNKLSGTLTIPDSVISIGNNAFYGNDFARFLSIGNSVVSIGDYAFSNAVSDPFKFAGGLTIPDSVVKIGISAFENNNFNQTLTIGKNVTSIGNNAFKNNRFIKFVNNSKIPGNQIRKIGGIGPLPRSS